MKILPNIPAAVKIYSALRYLNKEKKILEDYQKVLEEKSAKVTELSVKTTLEDAKANVKEKNIFSRNGWECSSRL